ncbi:hypothetical protein BSZ22_31630 [Bradyrhizobium canariense]|uniref:Uncharacterized protein n=1 Tax=Bradyrhizobium canariense TaxID=255045 RepID=A0A1X3FFB7_9BRAD|nr:hypothetical protein BSZ22_31630 [Bradyrhizobium canariense]OSI75771.1 hypothetical protein BSZ23_27010 [Bradyrhizobium canariense]OSI85527.1 hypothetical protein BSZ24_31140 [Bradyrhizobium canariense]OSI87106.1 hypothetical protein BSZ25_28560 [Bradyrhizobium canariense]OSI99546.1 hypothetical protein BSZ16_29610 [Bradyrhizobium canariense]
MSKSLDGLVRDFVTRTNGLALLEQCGALSFLRLQPSGSGNAAWPDDRHDIRKPVVNAATRWMKAPYFESAASTLFKLLHGINVTP